MDRIYIVTGANGHLGGTIVRMLRRAGAAVRGLVLPAEKVADAGAVRYFKGMSGTRPLWSRCSPIPTGGTWW